MPARFYDRNKDHRPFFHAIGNQPDPEKLGGHFSVPRSVRERMAERLHTAHALKAATYVLDRTFGHKLYREHITQREFLYGRTLRNGRKERGSGIKSFYMLRLALLECEEAGIFRVMLQGRGRGARTWYEPILPDTMPVEKEAGTPMPLQLSKPHRPARPPLAAATAVHTRKERVHLQPIAPTPKGNVPAPNLDTLNSPLATLLVPICEQWGDTNIADTLHYIREQGAGLDDDVQLDAAQKAITHVEGAINAQRADNPMGLLRYRIAHETANMRKEQEARAAAQAEREQQWATLLAIPLSEKAQRCEALLKEQDWPNMAVPGMRYFSGEDDWQWLLHCNQDEALFEEVLAQLSPDLPVLSPGQEQDRAPTRDDSLTTIHEGPAASLETEALALIEDVSISEEGSVAEMKRSAIIASDLPTLQRPRRPLSSRWRQDQDALWKEAQEQNFPAIEISSDGEDWLKIAGPESWQHFKETSSSFEQDRARIKLRQLRRSTPHLLLSLTAASGDEERGALYSAHQSL